MTTDQEIIRRVMAAVLSCTKRHFQDGLGMDIATATSSSGEINALTLRNLTAIVGLGGPVNVLIAFSFDNSLADHLLEVETAGVRMAEHERPQFLLEAVAETINVVLGHSTADLAEAGNNVVLSAPVVIEDGGRLRRPKGAFFTSVRHETSKGSLDIDFITPKHLFGEKLHVSAG